jgi:hypothetical protein
MMAHAYDVRGIDGIDYDAIRELARWIFRRYPALREKYPLDFRLGMRRHP